MTPLEIRDGLIEALELAGEGHTITDLEQALQTGDALLWTGVNGALVTLLYESPRGRSVHVWLGTGDLNELLQMEPGVSAWARARGCKYATINGRKGWSRVFKPLGFKMIDGELTKFYG